MQPLPALEEYAARESRHLDAELLHRETGPCAPRARRLRPRRVRHRHVHATRAQAALELAELPHGGRQWCDEVANGGGAARRFLTGDVARAGFRAPILRATERAGRAEYDDLDVINGRGWRCGCWRGRRCRLLRGRRQRSDAEEGGEEKSRNARQRLAENHEESFYMRETVSGRADLRRDAAAAVRRTRSAHSRRAASARRAASTGLPGGTRARSSGSCAPVLWGPRPSAPRTAPSRPADRDRAAAHRVRARRV